MIKTKIKFCLLASVFSLQLATSAFAMQSAEIDRNPIARASAAPAVVQQDVAPPQSAGAAVQSAPVGPAVAATIIDFNTILQRMNALEIGKAAAEAENAALKEAAKVKVKKPKGTKALKAMLRAKQEELRGSDNFATFLLSTTPTARAYFSAFLRGASAAELGRLRAEATQQQDLPGVVVRNSKQIRSDTAASSRRLLAFSGAVVDADITHPTITYVQGSIRRSPEKDLNAGIQAIDNIRRRTLDFSAQGQGAAPQEESKRLSNGDSKSHD